MDYIVKRIHTNIAKDYIKENHYSHGCHNRPSPCYGLFSGDFLIGVLMFATRCSERVRSSIFGPERKDEIIELHRLHIKDCTPKNTESWFISKCLNNVRVDRPKTKCVISFADSTEGHKGIIYRATNALFYGFSQAQNFWIDQNGVLRHPRQCGVNVDGNALGWKRVKRQSKYRYLWLLGGKFEKRALRKQLKVEIQEYPKDNK